MADIVGEVMKEMTTQTNPAAREVVLRVLQESLPDLRQRYGVTRLALYGSFAHGRPKKDSDVDLLVELDRPLGLEFMSLVYDLEQKLGRRVELTTFDTLRRGMAHPRRREIALEIQRTLINVETAAG
jgi:predicted nucleotidyltransferase